MNSVLIYFVIKRHKMLVAGNNLFSQWMIKTQSLLSFQNPLSLLSDSNDDKEKECIFGMELVYMTWSYNIFHHDNDFYLTGFWKGNDKEVIRIKMPEECQHKPDIKKYQMAGNDYNLYVADLTIPMLWVIDLETDMVKKLNFGVERPLTKLTESVEKKPRMNDKITKAMVTNYSGLFLTADGHVYAGLLPTLVDTRQCEGAICDVECGYEHFILLTDKGKVYTFGNGRKLQLGHGNLHSLETPTLVKALDGIMITKIRAGGWHSLALSEFGDLYSWGWNDVGQLGIKSTAGSCNSQPTPTLIDFYDCNEKLISFNVKDVACGSRHSAILLENNTIWTAGCNKYGQCGFSPESKQTINYFECAYSNHSDCKLMGGPWSTVLTGT